VHGSASEEVDFCKNIRGGREFVCAPGPLVCPKGPTIQIVSTVSTHPPALRTLCQAISRPPALPNRTRPVTALSAGKKLNRSYEP
jgi:hypothetical protein